MWLVQCTPEKLIIVLSFLLVVVICSILVSDEDDDYTSWLLQQMSSINLGAFGILQAETTNSVTLEKDIRIMCLVMTQPKNHKTRALKILHTWGSRCTYLKFLTTEEDEELPSFVSPTLEGYNQIWGKTKFGFQQAYEHYYDDVDWVMKADDDTYVVMENLRYLLSGYNETEPIWFGCEFKVIVKDGYMSGGAGYVLSKGRILKRIKLGKLYP